MRRSETGGFSLAVFAPIVAAVLGGLAALALAAQFVSLAPTDSDSTVNLGSNQAGLGSGEVQYGSR